MVTRSICHTPVCHTELVTLHSTHPICHNPFVTSHSAPPIDHRQPSPHPTPLFDEQRPPDASAVSERIKSLIDVLSDFQEKCKDGRPRSEYLALLASDLSTSYGYNGELVELLLQLFSTTEVGAGYPSITPQLPPKCPPIAHQLPTNCPPIAHQLPINCPPIAHQLPTNCPPIAHHLRPVTLPPLSTSTTTTTALTCPHLALPRPKAP